MMLTKLTAVAEMERDLLVARTQSGLARPKAAGKVLSRPTKTTDAQREEIASMFAGGASISALSRTYGVSRASIMRIAKPTTAI